MWSKRNIGNSANFNIAFEHLNGIQYSFNYLNSILTRNSQFQAQHNRMKWMPQKQDIRSRIMSQDIGPVASTLEVGDCPGYQIKGLLIPTWRLQGLKMGPSVCKAWAVPLNYSPFPKSKHGYHII